MARTSMNWAMDRSISTFKQVSDEEETNARGLGLGLEDEDSMKQINWKQIKCKTSPILLFYSMINENR